MTSRIIDLSHTLNATGMSIWPGHPSFASYKLPDKRNVTALSFGSHTGTHLDAPSHFIADGLAIDELDLQRLFGRAVAVDVRGKDARGRIGWEDIKGYEEKLGEGVIVLICTGWSRYWGTDKYRDHPFLDPDAARKLVERGVRVIGVDTLGPDEMRIGEEVEAGWVSTHEVILGAGGMIAENLRGVEEVIGMERPIVSLLPVKIGGCDGAPIRAIAFEA
ncbi:putative cyclase [Boletus edulis]|uniref:Cyclase n=1 Tax=Boletus edulis BED1 TaxID=1328754 RepID=A0AAD4BNE9_BOLED|nr:putative cyclase [Boletus edulis]KAF8435140.1 putative cyclase [Boletus edulis BED1]